MNSATASLASVQSLGVTSVSFIVTWECSGKLLEVDFFINIKMSPSTSLSWSGSIAKPCEPNVKAQTLIDLRSSQLSKPMRVSDGSYARVFGHRASQNMRVSSTMPHTPAGLTKSQTTKRRRRSPKSRRRHQRNLKSPTLKRYAMRVVKLTCLPRHSVAKNQCYRLRNPKARKRSPPTLKPQGGKEKTEKKKFPRDKKPTSSWSTKLADFRRDLKSNGIHTLQEQGAFSWAQKKILASKADDVASFIEGITILIGAVYTSATIENLSCVLLLYAKNCYRGSFLMKAKSLIESFCMTPQGSVPVDPDWLCHIKTLNSEWKQAVKNPAFAKISELLGMFVAMGIISTEFNDFEIAGVRLFAKQVHNSHINATSLFDAILATVTFFAEGGYYAIKTGSLKPLLFGDRKLLEFDDEYIQLQGLFSAAIAGNLIKMDTSAQEFERRVNSFIEVGDQLTAILPSGFERKLVQERLVNIKKEYSEYTQKRIEGGSRVAPYMISVFGKSGVGKSTLVDFIVPYILQVNGFESRDEYITTLNPNSKHDTNWRSYMTAMKLDDWNNSKADKSEVNPAQKIIDYCNNVRIYAEMADIERKGKVAIEPKVVTITTNTKDLGARDFSNEPASIVRRPKLHIELKVKPQFRKKNTNELDTDKVVDFYKDKEFSIQDIWLISCSYVKIVPNLKMSTKQKVKSGIGIARRPKKAVEQYCTEDRDVFHTPDDYSWVLYEDSKGIMEDVSMDRFLPFLREATRTHFAGQDLISDWTKDVGERLNLCPECSLPATYCVCPPPPSTIPEVDTTSTLTSDEVIEVPSPPPPEEVETVVFHEQHGGMEVAATFKAMFLDCYYKFDITNYTTPWKRWKWRWLERNFFAWFSNMMADTFPVIGMCEELTMQKCYELMKKADDNPYLKWTSYVPDSWLDNKIAEKYILRSSNARFCGKVYNTFNVCNYIIGAGCVSLLSSCIAWKMGRRLGAVKLAVIGTGSVLNALSLRESAKVRLLESVREDRNLMPIFIKNVRNDYLKYTLETFAFLALIYSVHKLYQRASAHYKEGTPQDGVIDNPTEEDVKERDAKGTERFWESELKPEDFDSIPRSKWTNNSELSKTVQSNLLHVRFTKDDKTQYCNGLMLRTNYLLVPSHMITRGVDEMECIRKPADGVCRNASFSFPFDPLTVQKVTGHDLCILYVPNSGDFSNIMDAFPSEKIMASLPFLMEWRDREGVVHQYSGMSSPKMVRIGVSTYWGSAYNLSENTFQGLCMAPLLAQCKFPSILGVHLAGNAGTPSGAAGSPTRPELLKTLSTLQGKHPTIFPSAAMGDLPDTTYDVKNLFGNTLKKSSPVLRIQGANCRVYGTCGGAVHSKTNFRILPSSPVITEIFGSPNLWGPPKVKGPDGKSSWWPWQTHLESSLKPSIGVQPTLLSRAYDDYHTVLFDILQKKKFWKGEVKPLTRMQVVNGIEGKRFIDRMVGKTSVGYPLTGPKNNYLTEVDSEDYACAYVLDEQFWKEADRMEECFLRGERAYPVFKSSLKDEPVLCTKDKVRVFQIAPLALQLIMRKYFLGVARFLSCNPLDSECAVGVNPHGPEWHQLHNHVTKHGEERCMAIDYKKYDTRMSSQTMYAAFAICIELASASGNYTPDDLLIMRGVATEVSSAMTAYNGELLCHIGANPSGHNMTVYINSIVNSLLHRCAFFHIYPDFTGRFSDVVSLTTYGDDALCTVKEGYEKYNMLNLRDYLDDNDIKITMADKDADFVEYIKFSDADFLKRKSVYHEDLKIYMGALDEDSIFKPLHVGLKSPVGDEQIIADAMDSGLREYLYHGKTKYEAFRTKISEVAQKMRITHIPRLLDQTYEESMYDWAERHDLVERLDRAKYADIIACKAKKMEQTLITEFPDFDLQEETTPGSV